MLAALDEVVLAEIGDGQKARIGGLVQVIPRVKFATKTRQGRNPATGEAIAIAAKPATSTCGPDRSPGLRVRSRRCRRHGGDSRPSNGRTSR